MKKIYVVFYLVLAAACSKGGSGSPAPAAPPATVQNGPNLFSQSPQPSANSTSVAGVWEAPHMTKNGITYTVRFRISNSKMTIATKCESKDGGVAVVQVETPARLDESAGTFEVLEQKESSERSSDAKFTCRTRLSAEVIAYSLHDGKLFIVQSKPSQGGDDDSTANAPAPQDSSAPTGDETVDTSGESRDPQLRPDNGPSNAAASMRNAEILFGETKLSDQ